MDTADRIMKQILDSICPSADERANDGAIPTSAGPMQPAQIIDELNYAGYKKNRELGVSAAQLEKWIFPEDGAAMEIRYQSDIAAYADGMIRRDLERRHTGGPEHDRDVAGRSLKAGT